MQHDTGIEPLSSVISGLEWPTMARVVTASAAVNHQPAIRQLFPSDPRAAKGMLMSCLGMVMQVHIMASRDTFPDEDEDKYNRCSQSEAEELCSCVRMLTDRDLGTWASSHVAAESAGGGSTLCIRPPVALFKVALMAVQVGWETLHRP